MEPAIREFWTDLLFRLPFFTLVRQEFLKHSTWAHLSQYDYIGFTIREYQTLNILQILDYLSDHSRVEEEDLVDEFRNFWRPVLASDLWSRLRSGLRYGPSLLFLRYEYNGTVYFCLQEIRIIYKSKDSDVNNFSKVDVTEVNDSDMKWNGDGRVRWDSVIYIPKNPISNESRKKKFFRCN